MLFFACFVASDTSLKLFSGGSHDGPGAGWLLTTTVIGLTIALAFILLWLKELSNTKLTPKITAFVLLVIMIILHLVITAKLGQGRLYWYEWNDLY